MREEPSFRDARPDEADSLTSIARASKAYWGYSAAQMLAWQHDLTIRADDITQQRTLVADLDGKAVAFCMLVPSETHWQLTHFWVLPDFMGRGIGRHLFLRAADVARSGGAIAIDIDADPNAEAFYLACDAARIGAYPAPIGGDATRIRPQMRYRLTSPRGDAV
jgi:ribosomal protein S18 acetylase RimI-like enzyme